MGSGEQRVCWCVEQEAWRTYGWDGTHRGPGLRGPGCLLGVWFCPAFLGCHPMAAVCNMIKFGFKKVDFGSSVGMCRKRISLESAR